MGISPVAVTALGVGDATAPVEWISPPWIAPESMHARAIASAKRLILFVSPLRLRNASALARKHDSVITYKAIDTASRAVKNSGAGKARLLTTH